MSIPYKMVRQTVIVMGCQNKIKISITQTSTKKTGLKFGNTVRDQNTMTETEKRKISIESSTTNLPRRYNFGNLLKFLA